MFIARNRLFLRILAGIVILPTVTLAGLYASCWVNQKKTEKLFTRIFALHVGESKFDEVEALWRQYGSQPGSPDENCDRKRCTFWISTWNITFKYALRHELEWKFLRALGIKPGVAYATLRVEDGILSEVRFSLLYQSEAGTWVSAQVASTGSGTERDPCSFLILKRHPEYLVMMVHNSGAMFGEGISVTLAPQTSEFARTLAQTINWHCLTAVFACEGFSDEMHVGAHLIMPAAYAQVLKDQDWEAHAHWKDYPDLMKHCSFGHWIN